MGFIDSVAKAAPILGTVIGGPLGGLAGKGLQLLAEAFGCEPTEDAVSLAVANDPDAFVKLRQIEAENKALLLQWQKAQLDAEIADRASARKRDVQLVKVRGNNWRADVLAILSIGGLIILMYTLLFVELPAGPARDVLLLLAGALVSIVKEVYSFEFGSSRGSKEKDELVQFMQGEFDKSAKGGSN